MVFEVVINHVLVKLSVPSFGVSPARAVMGTKGSSVVGSNNRRDIVSSFCGAKIPPFSLRCAHISADDAVMEITPPPPQRRACYSPGSLTHRAGRALGGSRLCAPLMAPFAHA